MKNTPDSVETIKSRLQSLEEEYDGLVKEEQELNEKLKTLMTRKKQIKGSSYNRFCSGEIEALQAKLEVALNLESDITAPRCVFALRHRDMVVTRVTAKRIYAREVGGNREEYFDRTSGKSSYIYNGILDVVETLVNFYAQ